MAKQTVNIGTYANKGNGDPLRTAFTKINNNFDELYSALGSDGDLFDPNSVDQSLVPTTTNTVDLGSASKQWRSLYVSNNTIYIGGTAVGVDANGNLTTGGTVVGSTPAWANITGKPTFATVATTGAYADLTGRPTVPTLTSQLTNDSGFLTTAVLNNGLDTDLKGSVFADDSTIMVDGVNGVLRANVSVPGDWTVTTGSATYTFKWDAQFDYATLEIPGNITGPSQTAFISPQGYGISIDTANSPYYLDIGDLGGQHFLRILNGASTADVIVKSYSDFTIQTGGDVGPTWQFDTNGVLTIPGNIKSENAINIDVNLTDSTLRRWRFGEDGNLDAPGIVSAAGLRTSETKIALGADAGQTSQGGYAVAVGYAAGQTSQGLRAVAIGPDAGSISQGIAGVAIGYGAGQISQGIGAIAIGNAAGGTGQGNSAIAIGISAGVTSQAANSIIINASGAALNGAAAGFYVNPIRSTGNGTPLMYNTSTKEIFSSSVLEFIGSTISTNDSSAVQFDSPVTFQTSVTVDDDLVLKNDLYSANGASKIVDGVTGNLVGNFTGNVNKVGGDFSIIAERVSIGGFVNTSVATPIVSGATLDLSGENDILANIVQIAPTSALDVIIPDASATLGQRIIFTNRDTTYTITLKDSNLTTITLINPLSAKEVVSDGDNWYTL